MMILEGTPHDLVATRARTRLHSDRLQAHNFNLQTCGEAHPKDGAGGPIKGLAL